MQCAASLLLRFLEASHSGTAMCRHHSCGVNLPTSPLSLHLLPQRLSMEMLLGCFKRHSRPHECAIHNKSNLVRHSLCLESGTMASSMAMRSCLFALVALAVASQTNAQTTCNTTLLQAVQGTPQLSLLAQVINASGLANTVSMLDNVTVLAPDNDAFNGTGGLLPLLTANNLTLAQVTAPGSNRAASILLYHIIPVPAFAANLTNGEKLSTFLGTGYNLTVSKNTTTVTIVGAANNATVIVPDIQVCNSVVHIVNHVLLPAATLTAIPVANSTAAAPGSPPSVPVSSPPGTNTSAATTLSTGALVFGLSGAVAAALLM